MNDFYRMNIDHGTSPYNSNAIPSTREDEARDAALEMHEDWYTRDLEREVQELDSLRLRPGERRFPVLNTILREWGDEIFERYVPKLAERELEDAEDRGGYACGD